MAKEKKKQNWFKSATRIVGMHPHTYEEYWRIRINRLQLISIIILFIIVLFLINFIIFSYTPLGYLLPDNIKNRSKQQIELAIERAIKMEQQLESQTLYINNLQRVILGEFSADSIYFQQNAGAELEVPTIEVDTTISEAEKQLESTINQRNINAAPQEDEFVSRLLFYDPVEGKISQKFKPSHPGVDVVTAKNAQIKSCLSGWVVYSGYNDQDGFTIIVNHENDILSIYKHAASVFVKVGDKVKTGQAIGIVGNTGEQSTGPHLHFELWSNNGPLNPINYFSFGK